eukprot:TRINITY_DN6907_c0_g2_i1.p1 TRINITY_DN6907_c0_g2~~TRINITY_DN6907_c0_g2_i1.p1  ORF type:complete len:319 (-),score=50.70 TRINITY_DN6907_c0_g2_i1:577-1533(-)
MLSFSRVCRRSASVLPGSACIADPNIISNYNRDGYAIVRNALDAGLLKEFQDHVEWLASRKFLQGVPPDHWHHPTMRNDPFWVRLISDQRLLGVVQPFLGPNIAAFSSHYFCKMPGSKRSVPWHQDGPYYPLWPMSTISLWLAADRSDAENGCLKVINGSHTSKEEPPGGMDGAAGMGTHTEMAALKLGEVVHLELGPGDLSIHHPNLVHCSDANMSDRRRCGLTVRYISTDVHCLEADQPVLLLRGDAVPGINWYRSWPKYRPGYDMAFQGSEEWNAKRYKDSKDEAEYFSRTDFDQMELDIREELDGFMHELGDGQ